MSRHLANLSVPRITAAEANLDYDGAIAFLIGRIDYERTATLPYHTREFRLDRMRELLDRLGNPQDRLKIVHIAGTKGKGSTSAMVAAILTAAGYRCGLFTSPHLERLEERVAIDGQACSRQELIDLVARIRPVVEALDDRLARQSAQSVGPTYFEITTAMALLHFVARDVDAAVLEVGLGGRLDSTNVCQPRVSVITNISFDHMKQLGHTLSAIAAEKAGIIKSGVPVVSGVADEEPRRVIDAVRRQCDCPLAQLGVDFDFRYDPPRELDQRESQGRFDFWYSTAEVSCQYEQVPLNLLGRHQAANAAVALAVAIELQRQGWNLPETALRSALAAVRWPARVEVVSRRPTIVIDAAHNAASIAALLAALDDCFSAGPRLLIFATTREKDIRGMLELLLPRFPSVILTRYLNNPRGVPPEELAAMAAELTSAPKSQEVWRKVCRDPEAAWREAQQRTTLEHLVCVTGSFFIAAEIREQIAAQGR